jgi:peptidyl-prolyl cis-trans isomerase B (cyclophilin B)
MIQGGGLTSDLQRKITRPEIENESKNGLSNKRGTISMARTGDPHSATAQFFINSVDNDGLDGKANSWGYAVFGEVVEGMDVVDAISRVETGVKNGMPDVPDETVAIKSAKRQ